MAIDTLLAVTALAATAVAQAPSSTTSVTVLAPATLTASTPGGGTNTSTLNAGVIPIGTFDRTASSSDGTHSAYAHHQVVNHDTFFGLRATVDTSGPAGQASVIPVDIVVDYTFSHPSYPEIRLSGGHGYVGTLGSSVVQLDIDIHNDGTIEHSIPTSSCAIPFCGSAPAVTLPFNAPTTHASVRFTGMVSAGAGDIAGFHIGTRLETAPGPCTFTALALPCGTSTPFSAGYWLDHSLVFRRYAPSSNPPLLVIGFSNLSAPLPIPGPGGPSCILTPFPHIVVPMTPANPPVLTGHAFDVALPPFTATTPLPLTFIAQSLLVSPGLTSSDASLAIQVNCQ